MGTGGRPQLVGGEPQIGGGDLRFKKKITYEKIDI